MQVNPAIEGLCDDLRDLAVGFHIEDGVLVDVVAAVADLKHHLENFGQPPRLHVTPSCRVLSETAANAEPQPARDDDDDDDDAAESAPKRPRSEGAGVATNMNTWLAKAQQPDGAPRPSPPAAVQRRAPVAQTTVQITFTLDFDAFLGEENYPKDPAAFKAKVVQWFERRVGLTGEAVGKFLTQEKPTKVVIVAPGTKLAVYDPRGCVLVPQLVATATRKVVVPVFMGDIQERDRERLASLAVCGSLVHTYVGRNEGVRTRIPSSFAYSGELTDPWLGAMAASDLGTCFVMRGKRYTFTADLKQARTPGSVAMLAKIAAMFGTHAVLCTQKSDIAGYESREAQLVMVKLPYRLDWIRRLEPYFWPKQELTLLLAAVEKAGLFRGEPGGSGVPQRWVDARLNLAADFARVKTEAGQQTHSELRARRRYVEQRQTSKPRGAQEIRQSQVPRPARPHRRRRPRQDLRRLPIGGRER